MRTSSANAAPARNPAHLCSPARRAAGGTNSCEIECRNCAWTYDRWVAGKAVPGEARVAGRRGVWLVVIFITIAVAVSAAGLVFTALLMGRQPSVAANSTLVLRVGGDLQEAEPGGLVGSFFEPPPTVRSRRRVAAQGQGRSPHHQRRHPADRHRGAVGQGAGGARRDRRLQVVEEADHRVSRIRRRAGVLPRERLRQGVPHADRLARSHRHGELRAVPARHARQDRRLSRRAAHRRVQDGVEPDDRAHLHAGPSRDGRVAQPRSVRTAREGDCQRTAEDARRRSARSSTTGRSCPRTPCAPG